MVRNQADIARLEGITFTQVMGILRLDPKIQKHILRKSKITNHLVMAKQEEEGAVSTPQDLDL